MVFPTTKMSSPLLFILLIVQVITGEEISLQFLLRLSAYNSTKHLNFLGNYNNAVASSALIAAKHCQDRDGSVLEIFNEMGACTDLNFTLTAWDTRNRESIAIQNYLAAYETTHFVVGPIRSAATMPVSVLSSSHDIEQISYLSTSQALDNENVYRRFTRTIPTDRATAQALAELFKLYKLSHAGMIFVDDSYGNNYQEGLSGECSERNIVLQSFPFRQNDAASIRRAVQGFKATNLNVVFVIASGSDPEIIIPELVRHGLTGRGTLTIFGDGVTTDSLTKVAQSSPALAEAINGTQTVSAVGGDKSNPEFLRFRKAWLSNFTKYQSYINDYFPGGAGHSVLSIFQNEILSNQIDESFFRDTEEFLPGIVPYSYDAVAAACRALCMSYGKRDSLNIDKQPGVGLNRPAYQTGTALHGVMLSKEFEFQGVSGTVKFDEKGSRDPTTVFFKLRNFFVDDKNYVVRSEDAATWFNGSDWKLSGIRFPPGDATTVPLEADPPPHNMHNIPSNMYVLGYVLVALVYLLTISTGVWTLRKKGHRVIKKAQHEFLILFLIGVSVAVLSIIVFGVRDDFNSMRIATVCCNLTLWFLCCGVVMSLSAIIVKLYRILRIFKNKRLQRVRVKTRGLLLTVGGLMLVTVTILLLWSLLAPLEYIRVVVETGQLGEPVESYGTCSMDNHRSLSVMFSFLIGTFLGFLYILCGYFAYRVRNVDSDYQETKYLTILVVFQAQLYLLGAPIYLAVSATAVEVKYLVIVLVIFLSQGMSVLLLFLPKLHAVYIQRVPAVSCTESTGVTGDHVGKHSLRRAATSMSFKSSSSKSLSGKYFSSFRRRGGGSEGQTPSAADREELVDIRRVLAETQPSKLDENADITSDVSQV